MDHPNLSSQHRGSPRLKQDDPICMEMTCTARAIFPLAHAAQLGGLVRHTIQIVTRQFDGEEMPQRPEGSVIAP